MKLGGDIAASAGPVGRDSQATTRTRECRISNLFRSKGLFAGVDLTGDEVHQNSDDTEHITAKNSVQNHPEWRGTHFLFGTPLRLNSKRDVPQRPRRHRVALSTRRDQQLLCEDAVSRGERTRSPHLFLFSRANSAGCESRQAFILGHTFRR